MKNIFIVYMLALVTVASSKKIEEYQEINVNGKDSFIQASTQCGSEVLSTPTGIIEYKPTERLGRNERCVWVIRRVGATGFSVEISSLGFPGPSVDHKLQITSFDGDDEPNTLIIDKLGVYDLNGTSVLMITFFTGNGSDVINHTGFVLEYSSYFDGEPSIPYISPAFLNASNERILLFGQPTIYFNLLQLYVYNWADYTVHSGRTMKMVFIREEGWTEVTRLEAYVLRPNSTWELHNVLDMSTPSTITITSNDIIFLAYRKNGVSEKVPLLRLVNFNCREE